MVYAVTVGLHLTTRLKTRLVGNLSAEKVVGFVLAEIPQSLLTYLHLHLHLPKEKIMETLKDFIENKISMLEDKTININDLIIVKKNKNGTVNCSTKINNSKVVINYIDPKLVKEDHIVVRYGKKSPEWQQEYWYQITEDEEE